MGSVGGEGDEDTHENETKGDGEAEEGSHENDLGDDGEAEEEEGAKETSVDDDGDENSDHDVSVDERKHGRQTSFADNQVRNYGSLNTNSYLFSMCS